MSYHLNPPTIPASLTRPRSVSNKKRIIVESAEEYSSIVHGHANPPSAQSLYSGANYLNLAEYLRRPHQPTAVVSSSRATSLQATSNFVTVHDLGLPEDNEMRINHFCTIEAFEKTMEEKKRRQEKPSLLLFLQGHPSPEWLNTIGYLCNIDPEFLLRHLSFRIPPTDKHFTSPALPSTSNNIIQLRIASIICREQTSVAKGGLEQLRKDAEDKMMEYSKELKKELNVKTGDSIVRSFMVHDNRHSTLEQDISICVNEFGKNEFEKGWIAVVWLDHGNDLSQGPTGPWSSLRERAPSWKTRIIPTILHRPAIALKTPFITPRKVQRERNAFVGPDQPKYLQLASSIHAHYGRFLDEKSAGIDAFYALNELFTFAATSEAQFLNLVEENIVSDTTSLLAAKDTSSSTERVASDPNLSNLWCYKKVIDQHLRRLRETRATIESSGGPRWPKATDEGSDVYGKVKASRDMLLRDFDYLLERAKTLSRSCDRGMDIAGNNALVAESRSAMEQAAWVGKLTLLAFFFIPASFTTSVFGMNFSQFGQGPLSMWIWVVVLVPTYMVSLFVLYFDYGYIRKARDSVGRLSFRQRKIEENSACGGS